MSIPLMTCMETSSLSLFYKYIPSYPSPCIIHPTLNLTPNIPMHFATSITHSSIYPLCTPSYFFDACMATIETSFSNTHRDTPLTTHRAKPFHQTFTKPVWFHLPRIRTPTSQSRLYNMRRDTKQMKRIMQIMRKAGLRPNVF